MRFGSVCSGIEAASIAWEPLGWQAAWVSEIEAFPSAVLAHHWPDVPNLGDMLALPERVAAGEIEAPDVLVGGCPCQSFSLAGRRESLSDPRGNLTLAYVELADAIDRQRARDGREPCTVVYENVPGILSTKDNAFGCFLAGLAGEDEPLIPSGKRWSNAGLVLGPKRAVAWRILDAQYFGVAQRRRRVFVVASARDGFDPSQILFEFDGLRRDTPPRREAGEGFAHDVAPSLTSSGRGVERAGETRGQYPAIATFDRQSSGEYGTADVASTMSARDYKSASDLAVSVTGNIAHTLKGEGFDGSEDGTGRGVPTIAQTVALRGREGGATAELGGEVATALRASTGGGDKPHVLTIPILEPGARTGVSTTDVRAGIGIGQDGDPMFTLQAGKQHGVGHAMAVRRLTPVECERLQGFPDLHTLVPVRPVSKAGRKKALAAMESGDVGYCLVDGVPWTLAADGPRYKALGNSMAVPVMAWIGARIQRYLNGDL